MQWQNSGTRYGVPAQTLHWGIVLLLLILFPLGWYMTGLPLGLEKFEAYQLHKSLGLVVLSVMLLRLAWRWRNPPPPAPAGLPLWMRLAATFTHFALYGTLFLQVGLGIAMSFKANAPIAFFDLFSLPNPLTPDKKVAEWLSTAHSWTGNAIVSLIALHAGAALWHHFVRRDDVLRRMLPFWANARNSSYPPTKTD